MNFNKCLIKVKIKLITRNGRNISFIKHTGFGKRFFIKYILYKYYIDNIKRQINGQNIQDTYNRNAFKTPHQANKPLIHKKCGNPQQTIIHFQFEE